MTIHTQNKSVVFITLTGIAINSLLLILSIVFAKERVLFLDSAIYLFKIINTESFYFPYRRFIDIFNQILPWIGVNLHLPTQLLFILYSLNIQLVYTVIFLIILFVLKQRILAFTIPLIQLLLCYESFFLPISELALGISFLILLIAVLRSKSTLHPRIFYTLCFSLSIILIFSHPIMMLVLGFMVGFELVNPTKSENFSTSALFLFCGLTLLILIQFLLFNGQYESERLSDLFDSFFKISRYDLATSFYRIVQYLLHFPLFIVAALMATGLLFNNKKWGQLALYVLMCSSCIIAISLYMHKIYFIMPFFEIYLLTVAFFTIYTLIQYLELRFSLLIGILSFFMFIQIGMIAQKSSFFKERLQIYASILDQMNEAHINKAIIDFYRSPMRKIYTVYDTPYGPLMLSNAEKKLPDLVFTLYVEDKINMDEINTYKEWLFLGFDNTVHPPQRISDINTHYFSIDTTSYSLFAPDFSAFE